MTVPVFVSLKNAEDLGLMNLTGISQVLDRDRRTVHMWIKRRRTSRFPMPKATYRQGSKALNLFDVEEVKAWHSTYVPNKGGAPLGNRNWRPRRNKSLTE